MLAIIGIGGVPAYSDTLKAWPNGHCNRTYAFSKSVTVSGVTVRGDIGNKLDLPGRSASAAGWPGPGRGLGSRSGWGAR